MLYLLTNKDRLEFGDMAQSKKIKISTNGGVSVKSKPSWVTTSFNFRTLTAKAVSDGKANSDAIYAYDNSDNAANKALNYVVPNFNDITGWYLPSSWELDKMIHSSAYVALHPFTESFYWSSTEAMADPSHNAIGYYNSGTVTELIKTRVSGVRPIKTIKYSDTRPPYEEGYDLGYGVVFHVDYSNKIIYIGSKTDAINSLWSNILTSVSIDVVNEMEITVKDNDQYNELIGNIQLELSEDNSISRSIPLKQDPYTGDSQKVFLNDIIDNIVSEASLDEDSFLYGIKKPHVVLIAKRLFQDLSYDVVNEVRVQELVISSANKIIPPLDFVDYVRLSLVGEDGILIPICYNENLSTSYQYVSDEETEVIVDNLGYPILAQGTRPILNDETKAYVINNDVRYAGEYKYDPQSKEFLLNRISSDYSTVVLEYVSDPIFAEKEVSRLQIHKYAQSAMEAGIFYTYINKKRNIPMTEKERARREYYNELRKANKRLHINGEEIVQALR